MVSVPRVTTIGGMSSFQTSAPLIMPSKVPSATAARMISGIGRPGKAAFSIAATMPESARLAAIERSMQRVRITAIWPSARMIRIDVSL